MLTITADMFTLILIGVSIAFIILGIQAWVVLTLIGMQRDLKRLKDLWIGEEPERREIPRVRFMSN